MLGAQTCVPFQTLDRVMQSASDVSLKLNQTFRGGLLTILTTRCLSFEFGHALAEDGKFAGDGAGRARLLWLGDGPPRLGRWWSAEDLTRSRTRDPNPYI